MRKYFFTILLILFTVFSCSNKKEEQFLIKGDDVGYFLFNDFLREFNFSQKEAEFNFVGGGVQPAINAMLDKSCEFVFSLKKLNNEDLALFKSKNISPIEVPLFSLPILVIGNASLPIDKIAFDDVKKIFSGLYRYWWQLAKNKKDKDSYTVLGPIDLCSLDNRNGETHFIKDKLNIGDFHQESRPFGHTMALIDFIAHNASSIGFLSVPYYTNKVEKLKILFSEQEFEATAYLVFDRTMSENSSVKNLILKFKEYLRKNNSQLLQKGIKLIE